MLGHPYGAEVDLHAGGVEPTAPPRLGVDRNCGQRVDDLAAHFQRALAERLGRVGSPEDGYEDAGLAEYSTISGTSVVRSRSCGVLSMPISTRTNLRYRIMALEGDI